MYSMWLNTVPAEGIDNGIAAGTEFEPSFRWLDALVVALFQRYVRSWIVFVQKRIIFDYLIKFLRKKPVYGLTPKLDQKLTLKGQFNQAFFVIYFK